MLRHRGWRQRFRQQRAQSGRKKQQRVNQWKWRKMYPKVGNKLQTMTGEAKHKQHNEALQIFALISRSKIKLLECAAGRPLKELLHALRTEDLCRSLCLAHTDEAVHVCGRHDALGSVRPALNTVSDLETALKETNLTADSRWHGADKYFCTNIYVLQFLNISILMIHDLHSTRLII